MDNFNHIEVTTVQLMLDLEQGISVDTIEKFKFFPAVGVYDGNVYRFDAIGLKYMKGRNFPLYENLITALYLSLQVLLYGSSAGQLKRIRSTLITAYDSATSEELHDYIERYRHWCDSLSIIPEVKKRKKLGSKINIKNFNRNGVINA